MEIEVLHALGAVTAIALRKAERRALCHGLVGLWGDLMDRKSYRFDIGQANALVGILMPEATRMRDFHRHAHILITSAQIP